MQKPQPERPRTEADTVKMTVEVGRSFALAVDEEHDTPDQIFVRALHDEIRDAHETIQRLEVKAAVDRAHEKKKRAQHEKNCRDLAQQRDSIKGTVTGARVALDAVTNGRRLDAERYRAYQERAKKALQGLGVTIAESTVPGEPTEIQWEATLACLGTKHALVESALRGLMHAIDGSIPGNGQADAIVMAMINARKVLEPEAPGFARTTSGSPAPEAPQAKRPVI